MDTWAKFYTHLAQESAKLKEEIWQLLEVLQIWLIPMPEGEPTNPHQCVWPTTVLGALHLVLSDIANKSTECPVKFEVQISSKYFLGINVCQILHTNPFLI